MRLYLVVLLSVAGCSTPIATYDQLQAIKPGVTKRSEIIAKFGQPHSFSVAGQFETFEYYKRISTPAVYYEDQRYDRLTVKMTNGVVESFLKSQ